MLGVREVSVLDMAGAFGVLANKGVRCAPYSITKVVAPGERKPLIENKPECKRVIDEKISTRTVAMLRGVITDGTGGRASLGARPVAGKTGSAQNNTSAFFSGFTPQLSTSVWVGYRARRVPMRNLFNGGPVYGGTFPALIFHNYMEAALAGQPVVGFPAAPPPPAPPALGVPDVVGLSQGRPRPSWPGPGSAARSGRSPAPSPRAGSSARARAPAPGCARAAPCTWPCPAAATAADVVVPGVVGLQASVARTLLGRAGLSSGLAYTNGGPPGRVAAQSPGPGSRLPKGSYVTCWSAGGTRPPRRSRTRRRTSLPSARPLTWGMRRPMTLPSSLGPLAPEAGHRLVDQPGQLGRVEGGRQEPLQHRPLVGLLVGPLGPAGVPVDLLGLAPLAGLPLEHGHRLGVRQVVAGVDGGRLERREGQAQGGRLPGLAGLHGRNIACCTSSMSIGRAYSYNPRSSHS